MIKKNIFNNQFSQILILLIFSILLLSLERVLIFVLNFDYFNNLSLNIVFLSFLQGLRIDLITILTFAGIFILSAPFLTKYRKIILNSWLVVFLIIFTINLIDIAYFPYVHRHIVNELALLTNDLSFVFSVIPSYKFEIIFLILALFVIAKSWQKIINRPIIILELSTSKKITIFLFLSIFIFLGIRGKSSGKPFGLSDAFVNSQIESANLALNGFYSIYRSKKHIKYNFMPKQEATKIVKNILDGEFISEEKPLERVLNVQRAKKYNIVIIAVESLSTEYIQKKYKVANFINYLAENGIYFPNFYANGQRSIEGISTILTGSPMIYGVPNLGYGLELFEPSYLPMILNKNGYSTIGLQGSKRSSFRLDKVFENSGCENVFGAEDIRKEKLRTDEVDTTLPFGAVWDGELLRFIKQKLDSTKKPFFLFAFTENTHFPAIPPNKKYQIYPQDDFGINGYLNNLNYFDKKLQEFFEAAKKTDWFDNTIFIITGDHTIGKGFVNSNLKRFSHFKIPLIIYAPKILKPKVIEKIGTQADIFLTVLDLLNLKSPFFTISNSLFSEQKYRFGVLKEGNRMVLVEQNSSNGISKIEFKDISESKILKAILQILSTQF